MKVQGQSYRTIWVDPRNKRQIKIIDQRFLPHKFIIQDIKNPSQMATAIKDMWLRGAGLIGAAAAYGMYLACQTTKDQTHWKKELQKQATILKNTRPTAVNLAWAVDRVLGKISDINTLQKAREIAFAEAEKIADEDAQMCKEIGEHGLKIIQEISQQKKGKTVNILTHCNAGWLAFVDYGTALSPIFAAHDAGIDVHVWVDETRPRNQGAALTAWELKEYGIPHHLIVDNTGGHLMQHGMVDLVITGSDRCTRTGDIANKIGTYLKALAAKDNHIPFFAALPSSTIDWDIKDGLREIPIEVRDAHEVKYIQGLNNENKIEELLICPAESPAKNYGFDITPARLITGIITERGLCQANEDAILKLYPERRVGKKQK